MVPLTVKHSLIFLTQKWTKPSLKSDFWKVFCSNMISWENFCSLCCRLCGNWCFLGLCIALMCKFLAVPTVHTHTGARHQLRCLLIIVAPPLFLVGEVDFDEWMEKESFTQLIKDHYNNVDSIRKLFFCISIYHWTNNYPFF